VALAGVDGVDLCEEAVSPDELARASEVFLTGTTTGVMPVIRIDGRDVGGGRPGPVARRLGRLLDERASG
ncbi:MAG: D-amino-acid transaminase, partial [Gemmatimonadales bacterium]